MVSAMPFTRTDVTLAGGRKIPCHVGGSGDAVLYLHAGGGARITPAIERLAETRRIHMPVMPGFDGTPPDPALRSLADFADLAAQVIDAAIEGPCDVIGHSFGGWVGSWLAVRHPDKLQLLVLVAPAGFIPEGGGGLPADPAKLRQGMFAHPENMVPDGKTPEIQAANLAFVRRYAPVGTDRDLLARLGDIKALTLILHGTKDTIVPTASVRLLKERIPRSHLVYVYDAAHALDVDQPARWTELVGDFLTRGEAFIVNRGGASVA
jgi:pimeloyl-ACP methyl ester carboxylesterase